MNTNTFLRIAIGLSLLALLASCAPQSNTDVQTYLETEQASIVGGVNATLSFAKQNGIVGIFDQAKGGICTGSLIAANLVLTAGHCINVENPQETVVFFGTSLKEITEQVQTGNQTNIRFAAKVVRHERFGAGRTPAGAGGTNNDIGLILIEEKAPQGFQLAKIAPAQLSRTLRAGSEVTLSGFGVNKFQRHPVTGESLVSEGSGVLRKVDKIKLLSILPSGEELTFDQSIGRGACHGDSGGPALLFDKVTKRNVVIGVTSRGGGNCDRTVVYTAVMGYESWIAQKSKELLQ